MIDNKDPGKRFWEVGMKRALVLALAVATRLRPVLLTTLTTVAAMLPAAAGTATGSSMFKPFAITVIGGLLFGLGATLVVVPVITVGIPGSTAEREMV